MAKHEPPLRENPPGVGCRSTTYPASGDGSSGKVMPSPSGSVIHLSASDLSPPTWEGVSSLSGVKKKAAGGNFLRGRDHDGLLLAVHWRPEQDGPARDERVLARTRTASLANPQGVESGGRLRACSGDRRLKKRLQETLRRRASYGGHARLPPRSVIDVFEIQRSAERSREPPYFPPFP